MADSGIIIIGDQTIGYSERNIHVKWDIPLDLYCERENTTPASFIVSVSTRDVRFKRIEHLYNTKWNILCYKKEPISERKNFLFYSLTKSSERKIFYFPDTRERWNFVEAIYQNTPLLLKYPKYFNWTFIPQRITPEFSIWSHYDLNEKEITIKITADSLQSPLIFNSGVDSHLFEIRRELENPKIYKVAVFVDYTFAPEDNVSCHLSCFDVKNNPLKPGFW